MNHAGTWTYKDSVAHVGVTREKNDFLAISNFYIL